MITFRHIIFLSFLFASYELSSGQKLTMIRTGELEEILYNREDKLYVLNFWASWCGPCIKELPYFEKLAAEVDPEKVRFLLVSLDFPGQVERRLKPFLRKNKITLDVAVMTDLDYNNWIGKVDQDWQGNLPATLVFNNNRKIRCFQAEPLEEEQLRELIHSSVY